MLRVTACLLVIVGLAVSLRAQGADHAIDRERAVALGATLAAKVRSRTDAVRIAAVDAYLAGLGRQLAAGIPNGPTHWEFQAVKQPGDWSHEPLGLPDGYIFIPADLILSAQNQDEFAAMLAHAMAHAARPVLLTESSGGHGLRPTIPLLYLASDLGLQGTEQSQAVPVSLRSEQKDRELEADAVAVRASSAAGLNAHALLAYLDRMKPTGNFGSEAEKALTSARLNQLRHSLAGVTAQPATPSPSFLSVQEQVRVDDQTRTTASKVPSLIAPSK